MKQDGAIPGHRRQNVWLSNPVRIALGALFLAALGVFSYLATSIDHFPGEVRLSTWVQSWQTLWLKASMEAVSVAGQELVAASIVLLAAVALFMKGLRKEGGLIVVATLVGYGIRTALKLAIARPRPSDDLVQVMEQTDGYSFPSGHVMHYAVFLGTLAFIVSASMKPGLGRWLVQAAIVAVLVYVGLSRIYLGVHWLGDVVAGYAFGAVVVAGAIWTWRRWIDSGEPTPRPKEPS